MTNRYDFFGGKTGREIAASRAGSKALSSAERVLEASARVSAALNIRIEQKGLQTAVSAIKNRDALLGVFETQGITPFDFEAVQRYKKLRIQSTSRERRAEAVELMKENLPRFFLHGWSGVILAWLGLFCVFPLIVPIIIDQVWYDVSFVTSYAVLFMFQLMFAFMFIHSDDDIKQFGRFFGGALSIALFTPFVFAAYLAAPLYMRTPSGRSWKMVTTKQFFAQKADAVDAVVVMDQILQVLPQAKMEFQVLNNRHGVDLGEAFLTLDYEGLGEDRLFVWHGSA